MAFDVCVGAKRRGDWIWSVDPVSWWDPHELAHRDPRFVEKHFHDGFLDFVADITPAEALELAGRYSDRAFEWWFPRREELHAKLHLAASDPEEIIHVRVYEWSSGLGD